MRDLRYALRMIRRSPVFTGVVVLSLALGLGANTAIFSLINALMLRTLPAAHPEQLVELLENYPGEPRGSYFSWASYEHYRDHNHVFSALTAVSPGRLRVAREGSDPDTVSGSYVAENFFATLGLRPALGQFIGPRVRPDAVVVSWSYWKNQLNQDRSIIGKRILVQDQPATIIGVAPREFYGLQVGFPIAVWLPSTAPRSGAFTLVGRLKPGVSIARAGVEMAVLHRFTIEERAARDPQARRMTIELEPAGAGLATLRDQFGKPLFALMALVGLLLLVACSNIAGLLLARGAARRKELALRVALGASRARLVRQALTESLLLAGLGSLLGVLLAQFGAATLLHILASGRLMPGVSLLDVSLQPDFHVLLFALCAAILTGVLFGLAPAWSAFLFAPASSLRDSGRAGESRFRGIFGRSLIAAQVAFSLMLLSAAGLFVQYLSNLEDIDLGFRRDHVLLVGIDHAESVQRMSDLLTRLGAIPGVRSISLSAPSPFSGAGASGMAAAEGFQERPTDRRYTMLAWIAPRYFETMGTPFLAGRDFDARDMRNPFVAIINQSMARYYFAGRDPLGKHLTLDHVTGTAESHSYEIVGEVGDAKYSEIREPAPRTVYLPAFQGDRVLARDFVLRTNAAPAAVAADVGHLIHGAHMTTLRDRVDATIVPERLIATLSGSFGILATVLVAIGVYGLLAYTVARRIPEFGIRVALGASPGNLIRMVLRDAMFTVFVGLAIGAPAMLQGLALIAHLIPGLPAATMRPIMFAILALLGVTLAAAGLPAHRASRVDPMAALRHD